VLRNILVVGIAKNERGSIVSCRSEKKQQCDKWCPHEREKRRKISVAEIKKM
jgi:hypothetical protein